MNLYHATPRINIESILKGEGLIGTEEDNDGEDPTEPDICRVHLIDDPEDALHWVARIWGLEPEDVAVFAVNVDGLELLRGLDGPSTYAVQDTIDASRLELIENVDDWPHVDGPDLWT